MGTSLNLSERNSKTIVSALGQAESRTKQQQKCRTQECDSCENGDKNTRRNMETDVAIQKRQLVWRTMEADVLRSTSSKTTTTNQDLDWTRKKKEKVRR